MRKNLVLVAVIGCFFAVSVQAADFGTALGVAIANVPLGADVAGMGNANTATPEFSSSNPAVIAVSKDFKLGGSATYGRINFRNGPDVNIYSGTISAALPVGVIQATYSDASSGMKATEAGTDMQFNSVPSLALQYGVKVAGNLLTAGDNLYLGVSYSPVSKSKLTFAMEGQDVLVSKTKGYSVGGGFFYKPTKNWNLGGSYSYSRSKDKSEDLILGETLESTSRTDQYRLGVGYQILPLTFIAADWQHLKINGFKKNQFFAGVEQGIVKDFLYFYGGWAADGPTAGLGVYFEHGGLNLAYMHKPFSDLEPYLGQAEVYMVSAYINF
jgi:opacity protein-like surface antigen